VLGVGYFGPCYCCFLALVAFEGLIFNRLRWVVCLVLLVSSLYFLAWDVGNYCELIYFVSVLVVACLMLLIFVC